MAFKGLLGGGETQRDGEAAEAGKEPAAGSLMKSWRELRDKNPEWFGDLKVDYQEPAAGTPIN